MVKSAKEVTSTTSQELLTVSEVALILRVDTTTVRRWVTTKALDAVILPHRGARQAYRVRRSTIDKMLSTPAVEK